MFFCANGSDVVYVHDTGTIGQCYLVGWDGIVIGHHCYFLLSKLDIYRGQCFVDKLGQHPGKLVHVYEGVRKEMEP